MGCDEESGLKEIDENHKIPESQNFQKIKDLDLTKNNNEYITKCSNYFNNENELSKFTETKLKIPNFSTQIQKLIQIKNENMEWRTAKEIFGENVKIFGDTTSMNDIILGPADNSYFVSAISSLANFPNIILQLFRTFELPEDDEPIEVCLKIEGNWTVVCVDNKFLVNKVDNLPVFSNSPTKNIWGLILEKAWAKVCGGYENIVFGNSKAVFEAFTPFRILEINLKKFEEDVFWKYIKSTLEHNCIITCLTKYNIKGLDSIGFINNYVFSLLGIQEDKKDRNSLERNVQLRNSLGDNEVFENNITDEIKNLGIIRFDENGIFIMKYKNFIELFTSITICVPSSTLINYLIEIPKEEANDFGTIRLLIENDTKINISIISKNSKFSENAKDTNLFKNLILIQLFREKQKAAFINSSLNETLYSPLSPGEYIILFNVDYKTANIKIPESFYISISSTTQIKYILYEPDDNFGLLKHIMIQKIVTLEKYKQLLKSEFPVFTGNKFESTSFAFYFIKNNKKETKYVKPSVYLRNFQSIEGDFPNALKMKKDSIFLFIFNRINSKSAFQTGANVGFFKEIVQDAKEPILYDKIPNKFCEEIEFKENKCNYEFVG